MNQTNSEAREGKNGDRYTRIIGAEAERHLIRGGRHRDDKRRQDKENYGTR